MPNQNLIETTVRLSVPLPGLGSRYVSEASDLLERALETVAAMGIRITTDGLERIVTRRIKATPLPLPVTAVEEGPDNQQKGDAGSEFSSSGGPHADERPGAGTAGAGRLVDQEVVGVPYPRKRSG